MRVGAGVTRKALHGGLSLIERRAHPLQDESRILVSLELDGRPAAARQQRVSLQVMADLVRENAQSGPVSVDIGNPEHEVLVIENVPRTFVDDRDCVVDVSGLNDEILSQTRIAQ